MRVLLGLLLVPLALLAATGCDPIGERGMATGEVSPLADVEPPDEDEVRLSLYFRSGDGANAHLERVTRRVGVDGNLLRQALELLVEGPTQDEAGLAATLPPTTRVREVDVSGGMAHVVLSAEVIRDAAVVGRSPANEALALAAITNTLTDFPSVETVRLEVEGADVDVDEFWGGWGLPAVLVRDETVVGVQAVGEGVPDLGRFSGEAQSTGSDDAGGVVVSAMRVRDRLTHVRVMVELESPGGSDVAGAKVPRAHAWTTEDAIVIDVSAVQGLAPGLERVRALSLPDDAFQELSLNQGERSTTVRLAVDGAPERRFWLHSLSGPTRIVLDVKK